ncbi:MAG: AAA family ATPase [Oscillospiraceae bacterium]|nr:AAA family ATPase [Oscillospiraceae bacterium]
MIIWLNGAFGAGKTTTAYELQRYLPNSFIYDPENIGYFLRKNIPSQCDSADFQDIPLWRSFNYDTLKLIAATYPGTVIVPMTLVSRRYYEEIIGRLQAEGVQVRHFILYASRETILKRLRLRTLWLNTLRRESFAISAIPRCLDFFDNQVTEIKILTDDMTVDQVVASVADKSGLSLTANSDGFLKKAYRRLRVSLSHIRILL